jgi:hypothetical protein
MCTTDKPISRFPLAGLPAGLADRALISHRGVGAFAPASLSDAVYSFNAAKLSNKIRMFFCFFYKPLKVRDLNLFHRPKFQPDRRLAAEIQVVVGAKSREKDSSVTFPQTNLVFESCKHG